MEYEREILQLQDLSQRLTLELDSYKKQLELRSHMTEVLPLRLRLKILGKVAFNHF